MPNGTHTLVDVQCLVFVLASARLPRLQHRISTCMLHTRTFVSSRSGGENGLFTGGFYCAAGTIYYKVIKSRFAIKPHGFPKVLCFCAHAVVLCI